MHRQLGTGISDVPEIKQRISAGTDPIEFVVLRQNTHCYMVIQNTN